MYLYANNFSIKLFNPKHYSCVFYFTHLVADCGNWLYVIFVWSVIYNEILFLKQIYL